MKKTQVGRISKLFGSEGELMVSLFDTFPQQPEAGKPLWVVVDGLDVPLFAEKFDRRGRTSAVVSFADIDTQRRATEMIGKELYLPAEADLVSEEDDELYLDDLVGYHAYLGEGKEGEISDFIDSELNPLFEIKITDKQILIPAADDFIEKVDAKRRRIWFALPEGLLDLND